MLLDLLYPRHCLICGRSSPEPLRHLCWDCLADTPRVEPPFCRVCGDPVAGAVQHDYTCFACSRQPPAFDRARSALLYDGAAGEALRGLKYHQSLWLADDLAVLLAAAVQAEYADVPFTAVTAVPLHPLRLRERSFNQSALLAAALARRLDLPFRPRLLRRVRPTPSQTGLTAPRRAANVSGAFRSRPAGTEGGRLLLVDDVMTTGATVNACALALKQEGARSVHVITVARG